MTRSEEILQIAKNNYPYIKELPQTSSHREIFIEGAKWADRTLIGKVCKWVQDNIDFYIDTNYDEDFKVNIEQLLKDIRKAVDE